MFSQKVNSSKWGNLLFYITFGDMFAATCAFFFPLSIRFETLNILQLNVSVDFSEFGVIKISIIYVFVLMQLILFLALRLASANALQYLGSGISEYLRTINSWLIVMFSLVLISFFTNSNYSRPVFISQLSLGIAFLLINRWINRYRLLRMRRNGKFLQRILLVGDEREVSHISTLLSNRPESGYLPNATFILKESGKESASRNINKIASLMLKTQSNLLLVCGSFNGQDLLLRELAWKLRGEKMSVAIAPSISNISETRISARTLAGLPILKITLPDPSKEFGFIKRALDIIISACLIVLLVPIFAIIALLIFAEDSGPVFFAQSRVGKDEIEFKMLKFRSMRVGSDVSLPKFEGLELGGNSVLFKAKNDPRITKIGGYLRKWSLDELPQLLNVFAGNMSLVGPRPCLSSEIPAEPGLMHRRFAVKPGITGLWQVSGRSDLSWTESIMLDIYYVDNMSPILDFSILLRTFRAVLSRSGAY